MKALQKVAEWDAGTERALGPVNMDSFPDAEKNETANKNKLAQNVGTDLGDRIGSSANTPKKYFDNSPTQEKQNRRKTDFAGFGRTAPDG